MYSLLAPDDVFVLLTWVFVLPVIAVLFEFAICGFVDFVRSFVIRVKKVRVIDPLTKKGTLFDVPINPDRSSKGLFDLNTKFKKFIKRNVLKL